MNYAYESSSGATGGAPAAPIAGGGPVPANNASNGVVISSTLCNPCGPCNPYPAPAPIVMAAQPRPAIAYSYGYPSTVTYGLSLPTISPTYTWGGYPGLYGAGFLGGKGGSYAPGYGTGALPGYGAGNGPIPGYLPPAPGYVPHGYNGLPGVGKYYILILNEQHC
jgi:hypothetical protein